MAFRSLIKVNWAFRVYFYWWNLLTFLQISECFTICHWSHIFLVRTDFLVGILLQVTKIRLVNSLLLVTVSGCALFWVSSTVISSLNNLAQGIQRINSLFSLLTNRGNCLTVIYMILIFRLISTFSCRMKWTLLGLMFLPFFYRGLKFMLIFFSNLIFFGTLFFHIKVLFRFWILENDRLKNIFQLIDSFLVQGTLI